MRGEYEFRSRDGTVKAYKWMDEREAEASNRALRELGSSSRWVVRLADCDSVAQPRAA